MSNKQTKRYSQSRSRSRSFRACHSSSESRFSIFDPASMPRRFQLRCTAIGSRLSVAYRTRKNQMQCRKIYRRQNIQPNQQSSSGCSELNQSLHRQGSPNKPSIPRCERQNHRPLSPSATASTSCRTLPKPIGRRQSGFRGPSQSCVKQSAIQLPFEGVGVVLLAILHLVAQGRFERFDECHAFIAGPGSSRMETVVKAGTDL